MLLSNPREIGRTSLPLRWWLICCVSSLMARFIVFCFLCTLLLCVCFVVPSVYVYFFPYICCELYLCGVLFLWCNKLYVCCVECLYGLVFYVFFDCDFFAHMFVLLFLASVCFFFLFFFCFLVYIIVNKVSVQLQLVFVNFLPMAALSVALLQPMSLTITLSPKLTTGSKLFVTTYSKDRCIPASLQISSKVSMC